MDQMDTPVHTPRQRVPVPVVVRARARAGACVGRRVAAGGGKCVMARAEHGVGAPVNRAASGVVGRSRACRVIMDAEAGVPAAPGDRLRQTLRT